MSMTQFEYEFYAEVPDPGDRLRQEAERRLLALTEGHTDIVGASVAVEPLGDQTTDRRYEARVVVYMRPDNQAATEKADSPPGALKGALDAVERQVRAYREKHRETWKKK